MTQSPPVGPTLDHVHQWASEWNRTSGNLRTGTLPEFIATKAAEWQAEVDAKICDKMADDISHGHLKALLNIAGDAIRNQHKGKI